MKTKKLALLGGEPARRNYLDFHRPSFGPEEEREIIDTLRSGWITTGPKTKQFERNFAEYIGVNEAIGLNSCTAGMFLALYSLGIYRGDEVITTPITFPATANVIFHMGAEPVFVDVEPDTLNMNAELIEEKITPRTKAIMPVHFAGRPCNMDAIMKIAQKHGLYVVEDAAHSTESSYHGKKIGTFGDFTSFSLYATKNITTAEGGMLVVKDEKNIERVRILSLHGISKDAWKRYSKHGFNHWEMIEPGYKFNLTDLQSSLGLHQLDKIESFRLKRKKLVENYIRLLKNVPHVTPLNYEEEDIVHAFHIFIVRLDTSRLKNGRDFIMKALQKENIGVGVHFRSLHTQFYFREKYKHLVGSLPIAESSSEEILTIPLYPDLTEEDQHDVVAALKKVIEFSALSS